MKSMRVQFKSAKIPSPGMIRLTWETIDLPGDAPAISNGDTMTRKLDGDRREAFAARGVLDWPRVHMVAEKFSRKDNLTTYSPTVELCGGDGPETDDLLRRILHHDMSGVLVLDEEQFDLPLNETAQA